MHTTAPVEHGERIAALDTLRGFALLGILVLNIQAFAMPGAAYLNPTAYGDLTGANLLVWIVSHVFFDQKFMTLFSLLFGAGIILFTTRAERHGARAGGLHYRRMGWLLAFGLAHAYGLWTGDILVTYAICGMVVYLFRRRSPATLFTLGLASIAIGSAIWIFLGWSMQFWPPEEVARLRDEDWAPVASRLQAELASYRGGWLAQMEHRVPDALMFQTFIFAIWGFWRAAGLMLIGMALFKLGIITGERSAAFYGRVLAIGFAIGLPLSGYGVSRNFAAGWGVASFFYGSQWNYWASLFVSGGYMAMVILLLRAPAVAAVNARLAAVGRMAFTNYLMQTIVCTTIFYGHGFGLFGSVPRTGQALVVLAVWALQLAVSPIWLRHFQYGPFEWLWRSLTYGERQPFRRPEPVAAVG